MHNDSNHMSFDIIIIGAGPSGLATAIRSAQLAKKYHKTLQICIIEKGSAVGAHILSGAVFETAALTELIPDWDTLDPRPPIDTPVTQEQFFYFTKKKQVFITHP